MKIILDKIKEYDRIFIFRHFRPDGDAIGSTKGLTRILRLTFPEKDIRLLNDDFSFGYNLSADYGFLELSGESRDPDKVFKACIEMIKDALSDPDKYFNADSFKRCKRASYGKAVQNWNTPATICHNLVSCTFNGIGFWGMEKMIANIELEDVKALFLETYKPEMFALSIVEPIK